MAGISARRGWAGLSSTLAGLTTILYVVVIRAQGGDSVDEILPWVLVMLVGTAAALVAALVRSDRTGGTWALVAVVVLGLLGLVSILSIGMGFVLAAGAAGAACVAGRSREDVGHGRAAARR